MSSTYSRTFPVPQVDQRAVYSAAADRDLLNRPLVEICLELAIEKRLDRMLLSPELRMKTTSMTAIGIDQMLIWFLRFMFFLRLRLLPHSCRVAATATLPAA